MTIRTIKTITVDSIIFLLILLKSINKKGTIRNGTKTFRFKKSSLFNIVNNIQAKTAHKRMFLKYSCSDSTNAAIIRSRVSSMKNSLIPLKNPMLNIKIEKAAININSEMSEIMKNLPLVSAFMI